MNPKFVAKPTKSELEQALRQLSSRRLDVPSNKSRNVRASIPFSRVVMRSAAYYENPDRRSKVTESLCERVSSSSESVIIEEKSKLSDLEKAMMWR